MALIKCPDCKRDVSDQAPACPNCGRPIASGAPGSATQHSWEYKNLTIPLDLTIEEQHSQNKWHALLKNYEGIVLGALQRQGQDGWQADEPTDWGSAWQSGRLIRTVRDPWYRLLGRGGITHHYESVVIRLKRLTR